MSPTTLIRAVTSLTSNTRERPTSLRNPPTRHQLQHTPQLQFTPQPQLQLTPQPQLQLSTPQHPPLLPSFTLLPQLFTSQLPSTLPQLLTVPVHMDSGLSPLLLQ